MTIKDVSKPVVVVKCVGCQIGQTVWCHKIPLKHAYRMPTAAEVKEALESIDWLYDAEAGGMRCPECQ